MFSSANWILGMVVKVVLEEDEDEKVRLSLMYCVPETILALPA